MFWYVLLRLIIHIHLHLLLQVPYSSTRVLQVIACFHSVRGLCEKSKRSQVHPRYGSGHKNKVNYTVWYFSSHYCCMRFIQWGVDPSKPASNILRFFCVIYPSQIDLKFCYRNSTVNSHISHFQPVVCLDLDRVLSKWCSMLRVSKSISCVHFGLSEGSVINKKDQT